MHREGRKTFFITQHLSVCWLKYILNMKLKSAMSLKHLLRILSFIEYAQETTGLVKRTRLFGFRQTWFRTWLNHLLSPHVGFLVNTYLLDYWEDWMRSYKAKHLAQNLEASRCPINANYSPSFPPHAVPHFVHTIPTSPFSTSRAPAQSSRFNPDIPTLTESSPTYQKIHCSHLCCSSRLSATGRAVYTPVPPMKDSLNAASCSGS